MCVCVSAAAATRGWEWQYGSEVETAASSDELTYYTALLATRHEAWGVNRLAGPLLFADRVFTAVSTTPLLYHCESVCVLMPLCELCGVVRAMAVYE